MKEQTHLIDSYLMNVEIKKHKVEQQVLCSGVTEGRERQTQVQQRYQSNAKHENTVGSYISVNITVQVECETTNSQGINEISILHNIIISHTQDQYIHTTIRVSKNNIQVSNIEISEIYDRQTPWLVCVGLLVIMWETLEMPQKPNV